MIDETDILILTALQLDAKATYADIGKRVNLTAPTVFERIKRLERMDIIKGYGAILNPEMIQEKFAAFVRVSTIATIDTHAYTEFLKEIPQIVDCYDIAGEDNFLIRIETGTPEGLGDVLKKIRLIPGTLRASTVLVLSKLFERSYDISRLAKKLKTA
ncbi:MAG: Lrp/AsnC family transcriptional regulator [Bacteroidetes bacterium]|nr:Lrp/AsnC family transcriptional regulator [Bacteroidota bacterium]